MLNNGNNSPREERENNISGASEHSLHPDFPEEYISGSVVFFGRKFHITPDVLIPRLETEVLIKRARKILDMYTPTSSIDIGSGSGIIGVSCADRSTQSIFLDISPKALAIAQENFQTYFPEKKGEFIVSDLLSALPTIEGNNILLLANLPYIKANDWENMSNDTRFEPELALFGGEKTGFEMYERLFDQIDTHAFKEAQTVILLIEFGYDQREIAEEIIIKHGWKYKFFTDYSGIERFCEISIQV